MKCEKFLPLHTCSFILNASAFILHLHPSSLLIKMHLPTLPWSSNSHVYAEGDVSIDSSAAIAPGVILRADPDSKIVIAAGVCIGMGSVLHACGGTLEVEAGANLGSGVLIVGKGKIGANACIGAVTTVWNSSIEPWQVVPAASVVGDKGRQIVELSSVSTATPSAETTTAPSSSTTAMTGVMPSADAPLGLTATLGESDRDTSALVNRKVDAPPTDKESLNGQVRSNPAASTNDRQGRPSQEDSSTEPKTETSTSEAGKTVYGQGSLDRILKTLF